MTCNETVKESAGAFLYWLESKNKSPHTLKCYGYELNRFIWWLSEKNIMINTKFLTIGNVKDYVMFASDLRKLGKGSFNRIVYILRSFMRYLNITEKNTQVDKNLLRSGKQQRKIPKWLDRDQIEKLLNSANGESENDLRDKAILEVMYSTGMRLLNAID